MKKDNVRGILTKIICIVCAAVIAVSVFVIGFFVGKNVGGDSDLSSLEWVLSTIQKYYYFDYDGDSTENAVSGIVSGLDSYSAYYTAEEYSALEAENSGSKSGIGITYNFVYGTGIKVITVLGNSPACLAGLKKGDVIVAAESDTEKIDFLTCTSSQASAFFSERDTGEQFTLTLEGDEQVSVAKAEYDASYVSMYSCDTAWNYVTDESGGFICSKTDYSEMSYLPADTAYITLSQFYGSKTVTQFGELISEFNASGYTSLILDLRNNGGGYVSIMQGISGCFVKDGGIAMIAEYKDGTATNYAIKKKESSYVLADGVTVYVLANSGTASASEALIGVLVSYDICSYENIFISDYGDEYTNWYTSDGAELKTARTYGKGIMQSYFKNDDTGEVLKLTTAKIYWKNGKCIHDVGLTAEDGCTIVSNVEWPATRNDKELQDVLNIISSR